MCVQNQCRARIKAQPNFLSGLGRGKGQVYDGGHRKSDLVTDGLRQRVELEWWPAGSLKVEREWVPSWLGGIHSPEEGATNQGR